MNVAYQDAEAEDTAEPTLAERALSRITDFILSGELPLGAVVNEVDLARRLSMSRGPVREAVRRLQGRNLVNRRPYQRARVIDLGAREVREIFEFREALEGMACRLAAEVMSDTDIERLAEAIERDAANDTFDLHVEIARGCGNRRIMNFLCNDLYYLISVYRRRSAARPGRHDQTGDEHRRIVQALARRDADEAEKLMRAHIRKAMAFLEQAPG